MIGRSSQMSSLHKTSLLRKSTPYLYLLPTFFVLCLLMLVPMITAIGYSLMDNVIMNKNPKFVGLKNYATVLTDRIFLESIVHTIYFTVLSVIFHLVVGLTFALLLNAPCVNRIFQSLMRVCYILPWVFTATIVAIIWRLLLNPSGIINYLLNMANILNVNVEWFSDRKVALNAVTFVNIWAGYPFYMVSLLAGLQGIPTQLYEASTIDGANVVQKFFYVTIPQLSPIIISITMLDFIWTMQVFPLIWMTTGGGPIHVTEMLSTFTYKLAFSKYKFSLASTSAVIILFISMSLAYFYVKHQKARD